MQVVTHYQEVILIVIYSQKVDHLWNDSMLRHFHVHFPLNINVVN